MSESDIREQLASLTAKQRNVLDLLIAHKTSKEIARELGISPHTVDQRIQFAKGKLGVDSRGEVAQAYRLLLDAVARTHGEPSEPLAYEETRIAAPLPPVDIDGANDAAQPPVSAPPPERAVAEDYRVAPDLFEGRNGTVMRLGAIAVLAVLLVFVALGSVMMFDQLSRTLVAG
nr:helix-turn-helix transcriptional regulator [Croceibacterium ferulae]